MLSNSNRSGRRTTVTRQVPIGPSLDTRPSLTVDVERSSGGGDDFDFGDGHLTDGRPGAFQDIGTPETTAADDARGDGTISTRLDGRVTTRLRGGCARRRLVDGRRTRWPRLGRRPFSLSLSLVAVSPDDDERVGGGGGGGGDWSETYVVRPAASVSRPALGCGVFPRERGAHTHTLSARAQSRRRRETGGARRETGRTVRSVRSIIHATIEIIITRAASLLSRQRFVITGHPMTTTFGDGRGGKTKKKKNNKKITRTARRAHVGRAYSTGERAAVFAASSSGGACAFGPPDERAGGRWR